MKDIVKILATAIFVLILLALVLLVWYPPLSAFRIAFGSAYVLFLPGFVWYFIFFRDNKADYLEIISLSVAVSTCLVPLAMFLANACGIKIIMINTVFLVGGVIILGLIINIILKLIKK